MNKRAWIRIIEAVVAILFVAGVLLLIVNKNISQVDSGADEISSIENSILQEIQLNNTLRAEVLGAGTSTPSSIEDKINSRAPSWLTCEAVICEPEESCSLTLTEENQNKDIYAESIIITTTPESTSYSPKELKLFCWRA